MPTLSDAPHLFNRARRGLDYLHWAARGGLGRPALLLEMWRLEGSLPRRMAWPLPLLMSNLTPALPTLDAPPARVRELSDAVAGLDLRSPLGLCLRRSLLRYHFLRRAGVPVTIHFGARLKDDRRVGGHAWLTLEGVPYAEESENIKGFAVIYSYPQPES